MRLRSGVIESNTYNLRESFATCFGNSLWRISRAPLQSGSTHAVCHFLCVLWVWISNRDNRLFADTSSIKPTITCIKYALASAALAMTSDDMIFADYVQELVRHLGYILYIDGVITFRSIQCDRECVCDFVCEKLVIMR